MESHSATPEKAKISPRAAGGSLQYLRPVSCRKDGQRGFLPSRPLCFFWSFDSRQLWLHVQERTRVVHQELTRVTELFGMHFARSCTEGTDAVGDTRDASAVSRRIHKLPSTASTSAASR